MDAKMEPKRTGIFATSDEISEIKELHAAAKLAGFTAARFGPQGADAAYEKMQKRVHELALEHDLPDTEGFYGIDVSNGEFLTYYDTP